MTAVAEHFLASDTPIEFAGLVLSSGFSNIPNLMKTYVIGGVIPILSPLRSYPSLQKFISDRIVDTWDTASRLKHVAALSTRLELQILHARNDYNIGWRHSDILYNAAAAGIFGNDFNATNSVKDRMPPDESASLRVLHDGDANFVRQTILEHGGQYTSVLVQWTP